MYSTTNPGSKLIHVLFSFKSSNPPDKTVTHYYYFYKLLGEPKPTSEVEILHWLSKEEFESGTFDFSEANKTYLLPELIKDNILL